ncbi:DedA family protein [Promicromonospora kroppenstedtii]|uniref:DedA family protein n=1 Tax=Promicromonospora kroppenstedtii TaxID=440482 RepID=A0ABW7XNF0_9MICO
MLRTAVSDDVAGWLDVLGPLAFYLVVWGLVFVGTAFFVGVFIPFLTGDGLLFGAGIVAGSTDRIDIWVLAIGVGVAAVAGDQVAFVLGRRYGRPYLESRRGRWVQAAVVRTERFYDLFGWWSVVIGRYMPWARVFVPVIAGVTRMPYGRFLTANIFGALSWAVLITVLGYYAASDPSVRPIAYVVAGVVIAASVVAGVRAWRHDRATRPHAEAEAEAPRAE